MASLVAHDYGSSSSDEEDGQENASKSQLRIREKPKFVSEKKKTKRRKKISTSVLPPEILQALEQGVSDSDDDDGKGYLKKSEKKAKAIEQSSHADSNAHIRLASFLPAPKHALEPRARPKNVASVSQAQSQQQEINTAETITRSFPVEERRDVTKKTRTREDERQLERALLSGNFESIPEHVEEIHMKAPNSWKPMGKSDLDELRSTDRVSAQSWAQGTESSMFSTMRPSRLQRQRHQINQLAFDVKANEAEMLEKRRSEMKTKRQSRGKYGW